jgi:hypothetical protein
MTNFQLLILLSIKEGNFNSRDYKIYPNFKTDLDYLRSKGLIRKDRYTTTTKANKLINSCISVSSATLGDLYPENEQYPQF